jgi:hypothetical protein
VSDHPRVSTFRDGYDGWNTLISLEDRAWVTSDQDAASLARRVSVMGDGTLGVMGDETPGVMGGGTPGVEWDGGSASFVEASRTCDGEANERSADVGSAGVLSNLTNLQNLASRR